MARILNKPASIVEKGSTWQGCVDFFYIYIHNNNAIFNKAMQKFPYQHDVVEYGQASPQGRVDFSQLLGLLQLLVLFAQNKYTHPVC